MSANARGYLRTLFGQAVITPDVGVSNDYPSIPVRVTEGGSVAGIDIRLLWSGSNQPLRGPDDSGMELSGVEVELLRRTVRWWLREPVPAAFGQTEGPFSMFQIGSLPPGESRRARGPGRASAPDAW